MKVLISLREALQDDALLGQAISGPSWAIWRALLLAAMGEELTDDERELFSSVTGRSQEPLQRVEEFWAIAGRRSGKTRAAAVLGAYVATCIDWSDTLAVGERGVIPVLAASTYQAGRAFQHINAVLTNSTDLSEMLDGDPTADTIRLTNRIDVNVVPANFKTIRSITAVAIICDEIAFWHIEGSRNPDHEILTAARPALATTEGPLIGISSPYARRGELWNVYRKDYGSEGDPLIVVAKGASRTFNPTLKQATIDRAYQRDPASAVAEYGGEFRTDVEALLVREVIEELIETGVSERPPMPGVTYRAFIDPSGGSTDSMTLAIAHKDRDVGVLDLVCEVKPPFSPDAVVERFEGILKSYGVSTVKGDRYAGEWAREPFRRRGITYEISEMSRSDLYLALVPAINSGRVRLLDDDRVTSQLVALERKTSRTGRDIVDHPPGGHDDIANAAAGALTELMLGQAANGSSLFEYYRQMVEKMHGNVQEPAPQAGNGRVVLIAPIGVTDLYLRTGERLSVSPNRHVIVPEAEAPGLRSAGYCEFIEG